MTRIDRARSLLACLVVLAGTLLAGCGSESSASGCTSAYRTVATAPTWADLAAQLRGAGEFGRVASVRTVDRGLASTNRDVARVVTLLDAKGQVAAQLDVWRTADGGWRAGVWMQCTERP